MTPQQQSQKSRALCQMAPVIPVIVIKDATKAADLARALVSGGLPVLEVTLRSDAALDAIRQMAGVEGGQVGAGTVLTPEQVRDVHAVGGRLVVSPNCNVEVIRESRRLGSATAA